MTMRIKPPTQFESWAAFDKWTADKSAQIEACIGFLETDGSHYFYDSAVNTAAALERATELGLTAKRCGYMHIAIDWNVSTGGQP